MARVTLQTIADRVGVSRMTVSNAFSRPDQLSAELRERILAAADQRRDAGAAPARRARPRAPRAGPRPDRLDRAAAPRRAVRGLPGPGCARVHELGGRRAHPR